MKMPLSALEVGATVKAVVRRQHGKLFGAKQRGDLLTRPDIEAALFALRVGVVGGVIAAAVFTRRRLHFAYHPVGRLFGHAPVQRVAGHRPGVGIQPEQGAVVIEHFFKMRNGPSLVGAVAGEAAAQLVE